MAATPARAPMNADEATRQPALRNILLATDFSSYSTNALRCALGIARRNTSRLYLVNAVHSIGYLLAGDDVVAQASVQTWRDARQREQELIRDGSLAGIEHEILILDGPPSLVIPQVAGEKNVDLIVIGTHGRQGLTKLLLGSCAEKVFCSSFCPVLTVGAWISRPWQSDRGPQRILLVTDFSAGSKPTAEYALSLVRRAGVELIALNVIEESGVSKPSRLSEERTRGFCAGLDGFKLGQVTPQVQVWSGPLPRTILEAAQQVSADLLVMTVDSRSKGHMKRQVAYEVICQSECPVLTIPQGGSGSAPTQ